MSGNSRHLSTRIYRPSNDVYEFASDPSNLPSWASGLGTSVELIEGQWLAEPPMGRVTIVFAPRNGYGVLDHHVTLPSGETVYNPMRVIADGPASEVVFTLRRQPGQSDQDFAQDTERHWL